MKISKKLNLVAQAALLNNILKLSIGLTLALPFIAVSNTKNLPITSEIANQDKPEALIKAVFGEIPKEKSCVSLKRKTDEKSQKGKASASFSYIDPALDNLITSLVTSLNEEDHYALRRLFHPALAVSTGALKQVMLKVHTNLGKKIDASAESLWGLYTKGGSSEFISCKEDSMYISPQYGYEAQFGLMISILGEKEVGKIFAMIVPSNGAYYFGAFHFQAWTHKSKDFMAWVKEADKEYKEKSYVSSYVKYDLAKKLIFGKTFYKLEFEDKIDSFMKENLNKKVWEQNILNALPSENLIYVSSMLSVGGAGILLRFEIPKELSAHDIREHCKKVYTKIKTQDWFKNLHGVRCGYNLPFEKDHSKDGILGSLYVDDESFKKKGR